MGLFNFLGGKRKTEAEKINEFVMDKDGEKFIMAQALRSNYGLLEKLLMHQNPEVRKHVISCAVLAGNSVVNSDGSISIQITSSGNFKNTIKDVRAVNVLIAASKDSDESVKREAVDQLKKSNHPVAMEYLKAFN